MTNDELQAWLLLAGFTKHPWNKKYVRMNPYADYTIVEFMTSGRVEVGSLTGRRRFIRRKTAQQYIQTLIGDRHADIPSDHRTDP